MKLKNSWLSWQNFLQFGIDLKGKIFFLEIYFKSMSCKILNNRFYSPQEIASIISVSLPTARKLALGNELRAIRIGSRILVPEENLRTYLEARKILCDHIGSFG